MQIHPENLVSLLETCVVENPDKVLFRYREQNLTSVDLWERVCRLQSYFETMGIQRGSRVLLMLPNLPEFVISYFAILRAGAIVVPVNPMLKEREIHFMMEDCEARSIIADETCKEDVLGAARSMPTLQSVVLVTEEDSPQYRKFGDLLEGGSHDCPVADVAENDTAVIFYTSGHTGNPKGAELSHGSLLGNARLTMNLLCMRSTDVLPGELPFCHAFGLTTVLNAGLAAQATIILLPEFDTQCTLEAIQKHKITMFLGTPSMYSMILLFPEKGKYDFSSVRYCISGGSQLKPELLHEFETTFSTTILEGYGLCETTAAATFNHMHRERMPGSIGTPVEVVQIKLLDDEGQEVSAGEVGEIAIKSEYLMKGYLHKPEATRNVVVDGWFLTGDLARQDEQGFLYIVDRKTDMILKGGFNIYPAEIEQLLLAHPDIEEAAIIGVPDNIHGEDVKACIVLKEGSQLSAEAVGEYCRSRLARYKCPRYIQFFNTLPKNPYGRIAKKKLRKPSGHSARG